MGAGHTCRAYPGHGGRRSIGPTGGSPPGSLASSGVSGTFRSGVVSYSGRPPLGEIPFSGKILPPGKFSSSPKSGCPKFPGQGKFLSIGKFSSSGIFLSFKNSASPGNTLSQKLFSQKLLSQELLSLELLSPSRQVSLAVDFLQNIE